MKTTQIRLIAAIPLLFMLNATGFAFEELGKIEMEPASAPNPIAPGTKTNWLKNGQEYWTETVSIDGDIASGRDSTGCEFSYLWATWAPSLSWQNCNGNTGSHKITRTKGSPWPMKVKTKFSFNVRGTNDQSQSWKGYQKCKVNSAVRVKVPAGEFDTYKIKCSVDWETRTYWYAPELGRSVAAERKHKRNKARNYINELVSIETPS